MTIMFRSVWAIIWKKICTQRHNSFNNELDRSQRGVNYFYKNSNIKVQIFHFVLHNEDRSHEFVFEKLGVIRRKLKPLDLNTDILVERVQFLFKFGQIWSPL